MKGIKEYYEKAHEGKVDKIVKRFLKGEDEVVYGAQSVNQWLPPYLDKFTEDWDIYSHTPEESAKELEKLLDKQFGGNYFEVKPAKHKGTFKVVSRVTLRGVADLTLPDKKISYQTEDGINYATLDEQVVNIKRSLDDPESKFRWDKDKETLQRISLFRAEHRPKKRHTTKAMRKGIQATALKGIR